MRAAVLGLPLSWNLPAAVAALIPSALLFIALGLLCGTLFNDKQVGGMCGALLTNVTAFLAGIWFDLSLMGGEFKSFAYLLPFAHGADAAKAALAQDAHIYIVEQDQMPTDQPIAALYRYAE